MDLNQSISSLMTTDLLTVGSDDPVSAAKDIFEAHDIHHIPVVDDDVLVGIVSKHDFLFFLRPLHPDSNEPYINELRLKNYKIKEIMTSQVVSIDSDQSIEAALHILVENIFSALPVTHDGELKGIVTTHDIMQAVLEKRLLLK